MSIRFLDYNRCSEASFALRLRTFLVQISVEGGPDYPGVGSRRIRPTHLQYRIVWIK